MNIKKKSKKKKKKEKQKQTHRHREWTNGCQWREGREEGQDRCKGLRYKLLCIK